VPTEFEELITPPDLMVEIFPFQDIQFPTIPSVSAFLHMPFVSLTVYAKLLLTAYHTILLHLLDQQNVLWMLKSLPYNCSFFVSLKDYP